MSRTKPRWEIELRQIVPNPVVQTTGVTVNCACGCHLTIRYSGGRLPPEAIRGRIVNHGWRLTRKRATCPDCQCPKEPKK